MTRLGRPGRLLAGLLTLGLVLGLLAGRAQARDLPPAPQDFYYDELGVLSQASREELDRVNRELEAKTGVQIMVVTLADLQGEDAFTYSVDLFNAWGLGDGDQDNGLLIFLAQDLASQQHFIEIRTGYQAEVFLPDGRVGRLIDRFMMPAFQEGDLDRGLMEGFRALVGQVEEEYGVEMTGDYQAYQEDLDQKEGPSLVSILIFLAFMYFVHKHFIRPSNSYRGRGPRPPFGGWGGFGGFGGFSGGSSGGSSSRGGGFTGGGGSTGGGGAGRSF